MKRKVLSFVSCFVIVLALVVGVFSNIQTVLAAEDKHTVTIDYNTDRVKENLSIVPSTFTASTINTTIEVSHGEFAKIRNPHSDINRYYSFDWTVNGEVVNVASYPILEDTTFVIEWTPKIYHIYYRLEDPSLAPSIENYIESQEFTCEDKFMVNRLFLHGYTFLGWFEGGAYDSPIDVLPKNTSGDWVLTGRFSLDQYSINYYVGDGEVKGPRTYNIHSEDIVLDTPILEGHIFKGWYLDEEFQNAISTIDCSQGGNINLYPDWELEKYTVTYILPDGSSDMVTTEYGHKADLPKLKTNIFRIVTTEESRDNITSDRVIHIKYINIWYLYVIGVAAIAIAIVVVIIVKKKNMEKHSYLRKLYQENSNID